MTVHFEKLVAGCSRNQKYTQGTELREGSRAVLMQVLRADRGPGPANSSPARRSGERPVGSRVNPADGRACARTVRRARWGACIPSRPIAAEGGPLGADAPACEQACWHACRTPANRADRYRSGRLGEPPRHFKHRTAIGLDRTLIDGVGYRLRFGTQRVWQLGRELPVASVGNWSRPHIRGQRRQQPLDPAGAERLVCSELNISTLERHSRPRVEPR